MWLPVPSDVPLKAARVHWHTVAGEQAMALIAGNRRFLPREMRGPYTVRDSRAVAVCLCAGVPTGYADRCV